MRLVSRAAGSPSCSLPFSGLHGTPVSPPHAAPPPQDFVLLKERTLDEAPRPPKKAMDYSSSSEEVESSEDEEEESNGEPSEGSRDAPGAREGGAPGRGMSLPEAPEKQVLGEGVLGQV